MNHWAETGYKRACILYINYWKSAVTKHGDSAKLLGCVLQIERVRILCITDQLFTQETNTSHS